MKIQNTLLLFFVVITQISFAQNRGNFHHIIKKKQVESGYITLVYNDTTVLYGSDADSALKICSDLNAIVTLGTNGKANVDFFSFNSNKKDCIGSGTKLGSFKIDLSRDSLGDPTYSIKIPFKINTWTVATVPFRYRFKTDSSFSTVTTNLSASVSYSWSLRGRTKLTHRSISHNFILLGPFLGVTSVDLKKSSVKKPSSWKTDRTNFGLSLGACLTLGRNNFGIVISAGVDHAFGQLSEEWSYQNLPWIGLGVNTSLGMF